METGIIISGVLAGIIILDLTFKTNIKMYAIIQFLIVILATIVMIGYLIIGIINKSFFYASLVFIILGIYGAIKQYLSLKKQNFL
jgi:hypothetical protein